MAKYTEIFADYIKDGGELPSIFSEISGFDDLFIGHYADKEIGFETPYLFAIKLETKANIVVPVYKAKLNQYDSIINALAVNSRSIYSSSDRIFDGGEQVSKITNLPLNSLTAEPNGITNSEAYQNRDNTFNSTQEDNTPAELMAKIQFYQSRQRTIMEALLDEFSDLFMKVY